MQNTAAQRGARSGLASGPKILLVPGRVADESTRTFCTAYRQCVVGLNVLALPSVTANVTGCKVGREIARYGRAEHVSAGAGF
jgi:hypothetical protein